MADFRESADQQRAAALDAMERAKAAARSIVVAVAGEEESDGIMAATDSLVENLVVALAGFGNAISFQNLAEILDAQKALALAGGLSEQRRRTMEKANAIRNAAANGDWNEFDRLAAGGDPVEAGAGSGGSGEESGGP